MRLLELRHGEAGRTSGAVRHVAETYRGESTGEGTPDVAVADAPRLRVAIVAAPKGGVIPGALVSVVIDVFNDGTAPAPESKLVLSLPIETEFRAGTLRVDGREVQAPERLFGDGLPVARLPGATSSKIVFQIQVRPGLNPLYLQPRLHTNGVPVVGTPGISVKRKAAPGTRTAEPERPFYELTDDEVAAVETESAAPIIPPVLPAAVAPVVPPPVPPATEAAAPAPPAAPAAPAPPPAPKRARRATAPATPVAVEAEPKAGAAPAKAAAPAPDAVAAEPPPQPKPPRAVPAAEPRMSRFRTLSANDIARLERLFGSDEPGITAHFVLIATIACNEPENGTDASGYAEALRADNESLGRALVQARLGKPVDYRIEQTALDGLYLPWEPTKPPTSTPRRSPRRLRRDLSETECRAIAGLVQPSKRDPQLRLRIALLALAGATIEGVSRAIADECVTALTSYRSAVLAWLIPLCVASMTSAAPIPAGTPANVDLAGRRVVAALRTAYSG